MKMVKSFCKLICGAAGAFIAVTLATGVGGQAQTRSNDGWVYPVDGLFNSKRYHRLTEGTIQKIFEAHLKDYRRGKERELARHLVKTCRRYRMDPAFVLSVISTESGFRNRIVSPAGAIGLMQIMPETGRYVARRLKQPFKGRESLKDPFTNITLGVAYLAELRDRYRGLSPYYHLAAYNMGPARLDELRARPNFKPTQTLKYYQNVMKGVDRWRYYSTRKAQLLEAQAARKRGKLLRSVEENRQRLKDRSA